MNLLDRLFDLHKKHRWLAHVVFWAAVLVVGVSSSKYYDGNTASYGFEFITDGLYVIPEILAAYAVGYVVLPRMIYRRRYVSAAVTFLLIGYLACVMGRIFIVKIDEPLAGVKPKAYETYWAIFTNIPKLLYVYFIQIFSNVFLFLSLKTMKDQLLMQKRTLMLEKEKAETELKLLKAQLNPHFLFNTLNNIYSLSYTSPARTSESIARLADILDHILYRANQVYVPLAAEVTLIRNYIELEKLRYDSRLTVNFTCAIEGQVVIAPLILLSLVENAFKHGASNDAGEPVIDIGLAVKGDKIQFDITNTVNDGDSGPAGTERIGLNNLQRQLDHIYGKDHELRVLREGNLFLVRLTIELKQERARYEKDKMFVGR
jgi:hypothetical protein